MYSVELNASDDAANLCLTIRYSTISVEDKHVVISEIHSISCSVRCKRMVILSFCQRS